MINSCLCCVNAYNKDLNSLFFMLSERFEIRNELHIVRTICSCHWMVKH